MKKYRRAIALFLAIGLMVLIPSGMGVSASGNTVRDEQNRRKEQPANTVNGNQKSFGHLKGAKTIAR